MLFQRITFFSSLVLLSASGVKAEIVYNKPGERPPPKFACAPGTEPYGNPEKREGKIMCVASIPGKNERYMKHGMFMSFDEHQEMRRKGLYYEDKKHGRWTDYDRYGRRKQQDDYEYGKLKKRVVFDDNGVPKVKFDADDPHLNQPVDRRAKKDQGKVLYGRDGRPL